MSKKDNKKISRIPGVFKIGIIFIGIILGLLLVLTSGFFLLRANGKKQIANEISGAAPTIDTGEITKKEKEQSDWKEGRIRYHGELYDYNQDIMTFLIMGIDSRDDKVVERTEGTNGGQADTIFLLLLNPHTNRMQMIAIDRNTMADVDIYGEQGAYVDTVQTQIAVQHGYGDGTVKSAEYMKKAVSGLCQGLPIAGYCALNMSAISRINNAVGGVTLTVMQDLTKESPNLVAGATITLTGDEAYWYARARDVSEFGSAAQRLERQKQYMAAFVKQAKLRFKEDPSLPVMIFNTLKDYMTTDISLEETTYLASVAAQYSFSENDMLTIPGETRMGDIYEEFYPDEQALQQLIIDNFYEKVEK